MQQYIKPFITAPIASQQMEEDMIYYYDEAGQLLAEVYHQDGQFCSASFYGENGQASITKQQAEQIVRRVQVIFGQEQLKLESIEELDDEFIADFKMVEPVYQLTVQGIGMYVTVSRTGFVESITLSDNDVNICYPEKMISKEQARAILQQQPILTLGIAPELGWQYVYKQNYDLYGISPDGTVRLWSEDETMQDAGFEPLPDVEAIADFEGFLKGNRSAEVELIEVEDEQRWHIESDDYVQLEEAVFFRACQVVKYLVGTQYTHYFSEQYPTLKKLLAFEDDAYVTLRFVYIYKDISFDFQAISVRVNTETNQILSVTYPHIPFETFPSLPLPTVTLQEANVIAQQLIDVELTLERDIQDRKSLSFVYLMDYPTSPTGGHIQYVDGFTGDIHWIDTGW